jgi:hypothetical protein
MAGKVGVQDEFLDPVGSRIEQNILGKNSAINYRPTGQKKQQTSSFYNDYGRLPLPKNLFFATVHRTARAASLKNMLKT